MNKDTIKQLNTREQCREKLPIFYGSRDNYIHGLKEVVNNAVDEITNNFKKGEITVTLNEDLETIEVIDTGRGIPLLDETNGKVNYELLFETLFAGTNYSNEESGKIATGTNGVGTCVLNHTSELFMVESFRNGKHQKITYKNGGQEREVSEEKCDKNLHGTTFTFKLDGDVYTNTKYTKEEVEQVVKNISATAPTVKFTFKHGEYVEEYQFKSIVDFAKEEWKDLTSRIISGDEVEYGDEGETNHIKIAFATSTEPNQKTFLNCNYLPEHGKIYDGIVNGTKLFVNRLIRAKKVKANGSVSNEDIIDSLSFIVSMRSVKVEYANQTKLSTNKELYKSIAQKQIQVELEDLSKSNASQFKKIIDHILTVQKHNEKNTKAKQKLKKALTEKVDNISNKVANLVDCEIHGKDAELFICEGNSAMGSVVLARNAQFQSAFAIRGKILNCLKEQDLTKILSNKLVVDIIKILGCGIEATDKKNKDFDSFNKENLRYGKIMLTADADADGQSILCLLLTLLYRLIPSLILDGMVYIVHTPLYEVKMKDDSMVYLFSETEKNEKLHTLDYKSVARCKGLGELEAQTMKDCGMNPETRIVTKVTVEDVLLMQEAFRIWMDSEVAPRREIIETELVNYLDSVD